MLPHFLKHCSNLHSHQQHMSIHVCVSSLPMTSTFCLDGHRLFYFRRALLGCVSLLITVSISPRTLHLSLCKFIFYFSNVFFLFLGGAAMRCMRNFPDQGSDPCPLQWKCGILTDHRGSPPIFS